MSETAGQHMDIKHKAADTSWHPQVAPYVQSYTRNRAKSKQSLNNSHKFKGVKHSFIQAFFKNLEKHHDSERISTKNIWIRNFFLL